MLEVKKMLVKLLGAVSRELWVVSSLAPDCGCRPAPGTIGIDGDDAASRESAS
jgi:hypothetical protein